MLVDLFKCARKVYHEWDVESPFMKEALAARVGVGLDIERGWPLRNEDLTWPWGVGV